MYNPRRVFAPLIILIPLKIHECIQVYFSPPLHEVFCQNILTCERSKNVHHCAHIKHKKSG